MVDELHQHVRVVQKNYEHYIVLGLRTELLLVGKQVIKRIAQQRNHVSLQLLSLKQSQNPRMENERFFTVTISRELYLQVVSKDQIFVFRARSRDFHDFFKERHQLHGILEEMGRTFQQ